MMITQINISNTYHYLKDSERVSIEVEFFSNFNKNVKKKHQTVLLYEAKEGWILSLDIFAHYSVNQNLLKELLESPEFKERSEDIENFIQHHSVKKRLPSYTIKEQFTISNNLVFHFRTNESGTHIIRFYLHEDAKESYRLDYPNKSYLGFTADFAEKIKEENRLLFLFSKEFSFE